MSLRAFISFFVPAAFLLLLAGTGPGCANIIPPEGGPRDSLPPLLLKSSPPDSSRNFTGNRITFTFDEYVELENSQQELIVSPVPTNSPNVTRKLQTISVKLKDSLEPNTTYTINFGKSIQDVNEGNIYRDFTYTFSTGPYFDSLQFRGNLILAENGEVDTTLSVMLHRTGEDSAVFNKKPRYVTRIDHLGNFKFINLAPGTYYLYAVEDESRTYRYLSSTQRFAFADSAIVVNGKTKPVTLYAFSTPKEQRNNNEDEAKNKRDKRLKYTTNLEGAEQDLLKKFNFQFETPLRNFDSSKIRLLTDTLYTPVTGYNWTLDSTKKKLSLNYTWKDNTLYHLIFEKDFATDTLGQQLLKGDTLKFTTKRNQDYGKLTLRFRNLDLSKNPVLQFVQNNEVRYAVPLTSVNYTSLLFNPGDYNLRILNDANKNGIWDVGQFYGKRVQPERVKPVSRQITVKPNWENQFDIDINAVAPEKPRSGQANPGLPPNPGNRNSIPPSSGRPQDSRIKIDQ